MDSAIGRETNKWGLHVFGEEMSRFVYKYRIPKIGDDFNVEIPLGAIFIKFGSQGNDLFFWFETREGAGKEPRLFRVFATGERIDENYTHLSSSLEEPFVWHLYEKYSK